VLELARAEVARAESLAAMDDTAKLALAAPPNATLLADFMKTRVHADMAPDQLAALGAVIAAGGAVAPLDAARLAQEQAQQAIAQRDAQVDRERRHQLDLLALRRDADSAVPARLVCTHGHPARAGERYCASCGAPLAP
jgi:hypothetical protein